MKRVIVYQRKQQVFVFAQSQTVAGVWIMEGGASAADVGDPDQIGVLVSQALNVSKVGVPHPTSWRGLFDPILNLAGVKSWSTFVKTARCVEIELDAGELCLLPMRNLGADGGFEKIGRHICLAAQSDTMALGHAVLQALQMAE